MASLVVLILPRAVLPVALYDIELVLVVLRDSVLRGIIARDLTIDDIAPSFHHDPATLKILSCTVLFVVLALRLCAHLLNSY